MVKAAKVELVSYEKTGGGYRLTNRGGKGVTSIKLKEKDKVVAAMIVEPGDEIMMTSIQGQMVRISTDEIRSIGRSSQGVKVIDLRGKDKVTGVSKIQELKDEDDIAEAESGSDTESEEIPETPAETTSTPTSEQPSPDGETS